jgi:RNA polymerase sigma factor (TIGR02999 family)
MVPRSALASSGSPDAPPPAADVTALLQEWGSGDQGALDRLVPLVYGDLRRLAQSHFGRESSGHTLQATAVVNELYLLLLEQKRVRWQNRGQFLAVAATLMRRILVDHARKRRAAKRGGDAVVLALDESVAVPEAGMPDVVALDDALDALSVLSPRQGRIVEMRFFGGLTIEETAAVLGVSPATVKLDWNLARAWLFRELKNA